MVNNTENKESSINDDLTEEGEQVTDWENMGKIAPLIFMGAMAFIKPQSNGRSTGDKGEIKCSVHRAIKNPKHSRMI